MPKLAICVVGLLVLLGRSVLVAQAPAPTGPAAEKRFPPLKLPKGFKATLFACDPAIEYPSAICLGPKAGSLFVAVDYMTGLGTEIVRRDEIRLLEDTDGDGYADKITVVAKDFNSIMGLAYHDGTLHVMHAPYLTSLKITKDGAAERRDLLSGVGLPPEKNPVRLHCANGVVMGHDGWLYLALGDNGCDIPRKGQKNLVLNGGGILRCRPDGSHAHVFASGLRNIYDVALDEDLNVFTRDNENDGGTYMIRWCHSFFGADHGYPYLYYERPDESLPPIADLGLGSSAGGVCYLETAFPKEYHGNLFFCEWGKSVVRCKLERSGSGFAKTQEIEFASGGDKDPYPFKPTDIVVDHNGAMYVSDWADGQRPKRGRARIYRIAPTDKPAQKVPQSVLEQLDSESYLQRVEAQLKSEKTGERVNQSLREAIDKRLLGVRGRMHAVWVLARAGLTRAFMDIAENDPEPRVQVQALRALVDRLDPSLGGNRQVAEGFARELANFGKGKDPRVVLEVIIGLGRLQFKEAPEHLPSLLTKPDPVLEHAAMQTLRRCKNGPAVMKLLDLPDKNIMRVLAVRALADRAEPVIVDGLIERLKHEKSSSRRQAYADALTRVYKKPGPWKYWGYRPPPRPANTVPWERTKAIEEALDQVLGHPDGVVRLAVMKRMQRENIPIRRDTLTRSLTAVIADKSQSSANRILALDAWIDLLDPNRASLGDLTLTLEDGPVLAEVLKRLPAKATVPPSSLLGKK
jgi:putative membrane-bound dehydrogenase-like protein